MSLDSLERAILATLADEPATIRDLVERLDANHERVRAACRSLDERGYLTSQSHGYFVIYSLTAAGGEVLSET